MQKEKKVKILILTQKVDQNDDVLGFFHGWIAEFAKHCEQITVIALGVGEYHLPDNVRVFSLGKERGVSRLSYIFNFYRLIWRERKNYDVVFVHMNQEYVLLGGLLWKLLGKKITMWRNHYAGSFLTRLAMALSDKLFCTSKYSFTAQSKKTILMPVGIDTELFKRDNHMVKKPNSVLFLARIAPAKKPHLVIDALRISQNKDILFTADFYGNPTPQDVPYLDSLKQKVKEYSLEDCVMFEKGIPHNKTPDVYGVHTVFVNTSPSGMYDKTIFEAMACESLILTSNLNLKGQIDDRFLFAEDDANDLAQKLKDLLDLDAATQGEYGKMLRNYVIEKQSLSLLANALFKNL
ncbi:MAG: glycosyltransferase family 4 protein [Minisyncoccota bacterium]